MVHVDEKTLEDGRIELLIEAEAEDVDRALERGTVHFLEDMGIPVEDGADPVEFLKSIAGENAAPMIKSAVMDYLVAFAITECGRMPVGAPDTFAIGAPVAGASFAFTASFFEKPEFELSSYDDVIVEINGVHPVTDDEVEAQLLMLAKEFATEEDDPATGGKRQVVPAITDAWVKATFGQQGISDVAALREAMRAAGEQYQSDTFERNRQTAVLSAFGERLVGEIPAPLVDRFSDEMTELFHMQIEQQGIPFDVYLKQQGMTEEEFLADLREHAYQSMRDSFALDALFRHAGIELGEHELYDAAATLQPGTDPDQTIAELEEDGRLFMLRENAERMLATQWALDHAEVKVL